MPYIRSFCPSLLSGHFLNESYLKYYKDTGLATMNPVHQVDEQKHTSWLRIFEGFPKIFV